MNHRALPWLLVGSLLVISGGGVHAHGIESSLERLGPLTNEKAFERPQSAGSPLQLESRFSSGLPASDAAVRLGPPDGGTPIDLGRTDAEGRLTFALPGGARSDWEVQVDAGPGHRDYLELPKGAVRPAATTFKVQPQDSANPPNRLLPPLLGLGLVGALAGLWVVRTPQS